MPDRTRHALEWTVTHHDPEQLPIPVIAGPTAGGKSALAVALAHALDAQGVPAEILTADSIQIYRSLDIGSAKPTPEERAGVPHHLIDLVDPTARFSVDAWLDHAEREVSAVHARGAVPIVVGGTHMYLKAFLEGLLDGPEPDLTLRTLLQAMDPADRRRELETVDPEAASRIHPNDERRTVRALEVFRQTGSPISSLQQQWDQGRRRDGTVLIGLEWETELLNQRINARVKGMLERGLLEETIEIDRSPGFGAQSGEALGYKQLLAHLRGDTTLIEAFERIKIETRRFAKNQRTWLRRLRATPGSVWVPMEDSDPDRAAQLLMNKIFSNI